MSTKIVNITGYSKSNEQFIIKAENHEVRITKNQNVPELDAPSPIEYILAGYAGCINAVGTLVAKELNLNLKSLQVAISGEINVDKFLGKPTSDRAGFSSISVTVKPEFEASIEDVENWLTVLESRCPVGDNLINQTPLKVSLVIENKLADAL